MSISAVSGVAQAFPKDGQLPAASPSPALSPFGQQLDDIQTSQTMAAQGRHHHHGHGGDLQTASGTAAATTGGASPYPQSTATLLSGLLS
jgi:hypothetical protein